MLPSRLVRSSLVRNFNYLQSLKVINVRAITTSKKNSDASATATTITELHGQTTPKKFDGKYSWQTYGFSDTNEKEDRIYMHILMFFGVTLCCVGIPYYIAYAPNTIDWEQREAFLELRRREQLGLPLIDKNYIDPSQMILPSDEELGDTEIII